MDRGFVMGGALVVLSVLVALALNAMAARQAVPIGEANAQRSAVHLVIDSPAEPASGTPYDAIGLSEADAGLAPSARAGSTDVAPGDGAANARPHRLQLGLPR